ncbi:cell division protein ZipA C-terminal FtsZ-binding domain-containing protein [uncultured Nevskia sp.]|uniref:cell division protein ZipA C-terminal FtsZ-binding domain-containing protein n=1 Tax=uncultured Nevskia sp. TaxID=228950 RepID=UPI0025FCA62D|nr:cell division protein ZipA C-terminal FtsZ-binding domain-containing protein [uncultured Nevskia sp.]
MSPLQWALLIFAVIAVIAIYVLSRRDRRAMNADSDIPSTGTPVRERQLDIFGAEGQQFDEFGVGKARRVEPRFGESAADEAAPIVPARGPSFGTPKTVPVTPPAPAPAVTPAKPVMPGPQKIVSLLIAQREGQAILGHELHEALEDQKLEYGARQIYHRLLGADAVFSVASLLKPGHLDPAAAGTFATPGLTLFMVLPGPVRAPDAIRDMIGTAEKLARALNAEVFDAKKQPFSPSSARALQQEVEAWARSHGV